MGTPLPEVSGLAFEPSLQHTSQDQLFPVLQSVSSCLDAFTKSGPAIVATAPILVATIWEGLTSHTKKKKSVSLTN